jgi:uncharacterized protein YwqG
MAARGRVGDDLTKLSVTELAQAYVDAVVAAEATEHVARRTRLVDHRWRIVEELKARGDARAVLQQLTDYGDAEVRRRAKGNLDWLDKPAPEPAPQRPLRPEILWQCDHPPPPALTRDEIAARLRRSVPEFCDCLMDLALPAIGLWPQRRAEIAANASRFGGTPLAPPDWQWPTFEDEPLLFVGQINCAELRGLPGADLLPASGLFAFFSDYDALQGSDPFADGGVYHWPDVDRLVPAKAHLDPIEVFLTCALTPRPILELPHPFSHAVGELSLSEEQDKSYRDVWWAIRDHGFPHDCVGYASFSKLLGWPDLVQNDLSRFEWADDTRLLLQVDCYCNGEDSHSWGPGGSLYYVLPERDLRARCYERCEFEGQFT